jgi:cystathionine beta-lyase/cystathionine gamma-synthase
MSLMPGEHDDDVMAALIAAREMEVHFRRIDTVASQLRYPDEACLALRELRELRDRIEQRLAGPARIEEPV